MTLIIGSVTSLLGVLYRDEGDVFMMTNIFYSQLC